MNCRSFDKLWEKVFEIGGLEKSTQEFVQDVFTYCTLSRMCYTADRLHRSGDLVREEHMRNCIREASLKYDRVLVITGGFHTYGLLGLQTHSASQKFSDKPVKKNISSATRNSVHQQMYPMVYTFAEADRLNGYASGMPYVNYYDMIWSELLRKKSTAYNVTAVNLLSKLTRALRKGHEHVSTSDAIEAYSMVQGLAALRDKREGGVYELMDAATSSLSKASLHWLQKTAARAPASSDRRRHRKCGSQFIQHSDC